MNEPEKIIRVAIVDDHALVRASVAKLISEFKDCKVVILAAHGQDLIQQITRQNLLPDILLLDLSMPEMDGVETTVWLKQRYPELPILVLTMYDSEMAMIRLLHKGVAGFLKKDIHPSELHFAIQSVMEKGHYFSNETTGRLMNMIRTQKDGETRLQKVQFSDQEIAFIKLACTDLTYKEIARELHMNLRSVDTMRDQLFTRLNVRSRVGLAVYSLRQGLVNL